MHRPAAGASQSRRDRTCRLLPEDAAAAIGESILWLRHYEALVEQHMDAITETIAANDAVATSRLLRKMLSVGQ
jgi:hypothetical protein